MFGKEAFCQFAADRAGNIQVSANNINDIADYPATEHHVIRHNAECTDQAHPADQLPNFGDGFAVHRAAECVQRVHTFAPSDDVFYQNHRYADNEHGDTE